MYEEIVKKFSRFLVDYISISEKERLKYISVLEMTNIKVTPEEINAAAIFFLILGIVTGAIFFVVFFSVPFFLTALIFGLIIFYYIKQYPFIYLSRLYMEASGELLLATFFIVIYMRMNPNLEKALEFAAENLKGPLGKDFKKLVWDIENRVYSSAIEALDEYLKKWEETVPEFVDAMRLVQASLYETSETRRLDLLDRAVDRVLDGSFERASKFVIELKQPLNAIYMLGIILPVLVTVLLPVMVMFAGDIFRIDHIFLMYNIFLPGIIFLISQSILSKRPVFFVRIIRSHPEWPKEDHIRIFGKEINIFYLVGAIFVSKILFSAIYYSVTFSGYPSSFDLYTSFFSILLFSVMTSFVFKKYVDERKKVMEEIERTEREFVDLSFQLGNRIAEGYPIEIAFLKVSEGMREKSRFLEMVVDRIKNLGLDVYNAFFHRKYGVFRYYKSPILIAGIKILLEASRKSFREAAVSMINFSRHLRNMEKIETKIEDLLGETLSSMRFNVSMVLPFLLSIVVGITGLLSVILWNIKEQISIIFSYTAGAEAQFGGSFLLGLLSVVEQLPLSLFQLIIGFYFIEVIFLISYLLSEIEKPGSKYHFYKTLSSLLAKPGVIYSVVGFLASFLFISLAKFALQLGGVIGG